MRSIKEKALQLYTSPACGQFGTGDYEGPEFDIDSFNEFMKGANYVLDAIQSCIDRHEDGCRALEAITLTIDELKDKKITMARWCLRLDKSLSDDDRWNTGCTDEWGTHHQCEGCPYNKYMGDGSAISL